VLCDRRREQLYGITKEIEILDASLVRLFDVAVFGRSNIGWFCGKVGDLWLLPPTQQGLVMVVGCKSRLAVLFSAHLGVPL